MVKNEPLYLIPLTLRQANEFADKHRRDHRPVAYDKFSIGCVLEGELIGAAIEDYPREHRLNNGLTLTVRFIYTTGGRRAYGMCSMERPPGRPQPWAIAGSWPFCPKTGRTPGSGPQAGSPWS